MQNIIFTQIDEHGATGTMDGKPFEVIDERKDENGNIEYGIVEGDFTYDDRLTIFAEWQLQL